MALDFADLPAAVRKAWDATVPPLVELAIAVVTICYILGIEVSRTLLIDLGYLRRLPDRETQEALKFYGLTKFFPIAAVIVLIACSQAVGRFLRWVGRLLPGRLVPNTTQLIYHTASTHSYLSQLFRYHPNLASLTGLNTLNTIINEQVDHAERDPNAFHRLRGVSWALRQSVRCTSRIDFCKGLGLTAAAAWFSSPILASSPVRPTKHLLVVLVVVVSAIIVYTRQYMLAELDYSLAKMQAYLDWKNATTSEAVELDAAGWVKTRDIEIALGKTLNGQIWNFSFLHRRRTDRPTLYIVGAVLRVAEDLLPRPIRRAFHKLWEFITACFARDKAHFHDVTGTFVAGRVAGQHRDEP